MKITKTKNCSPLAFTYLENRFNCDVKRLIPTAQNSPFPYNISKHTKNFIKSHSVAFIIPFHPYCNSHLFLDLSKCMYVCIYFYIIQYCSKVWGHFFFINTFIQHGHLDIFSRHLECYKEIGFKYVLLLWTLKSSKNPEKSITVSTKILSRKKNSTWFLSTKSAY